MRQEPFRNPEEGSGGDYAHPDGCPCRECDGGNYAEPDSRACSYCGSVHPSRVLIEERQPHTPSMPTAWPNPFERDAEGF